eukprot:TRINITY_DN1468_c0_g1_i1.p1 TRINITY_DN1468_c0_g1~~TRINITY_DN1468_c0_g1_i1.p1  ORF type:complete len:319 (+),score=53.22 TRINITY_DN1468_c0_g1_i1:911-1867(+)
MPGRWAMRMCIAAAQKVTWCLGLFCCGLAVTLTTGLSYYWLAVILPAFHDVHSAPAMLHIGLSSWLSFNILFNHYYCATTSPGTPQRVQLPEELPTDDDLRRRGGGEQWSRYCRVCKEWKPPRAHHCHFCGVCVMKMDHHCPWINNCVGHNNQRYFMNMLLYIWLETAHIMLCIALYRSDALRPFKDKICLLGIEHVITAELLLVGALFVVMTFFLSWNGFLTATNQTVVEFYGNRQSKAWAHAENREWHNPFDLGLFRNLQEVYGHFSNIWPMLLPLHVSLASDGHVYPTIFGPAHVKNPMGKAQADDCAMDEDDFL